MARKASKVQVPFVATTEDVRALDEASAKALAVALAEGRDAGMSGQALRDLHGEGCTGPVRRNLFRRFGLEAGRIARSYDAHRDGQPRKGTPRIAVEGSKAQQAHAERIAAEEKAAATKAKRAASAKRAAATRKARKGA
jgi:hypothetical protein